MTDISDLRHDFDKNTPLDLDSVPDEPVIFFAEWFEQARQTPVIAEPNAFVLTSVNAEGKPRSRSVLLKYFDEKGLVFFTNYGSQKARDIAENANVSVCFPWYHLERQILIEGYAEKISQSESLKYFSSRPRDSQIGAWVSQQSQVISSRALLMDKMKQLTQHFCDKDVPLPQFWGGYRIIPQRFEFWQGQPSRLHDRIQYLPDGIAWKKSRLSP